jgi:hypothetical protein
MLVEICIHSIACIRLSLMVSLPHSHIGELGSFNEKDPLEMNGKTGVASSLAERN